MEPLDARSHCSSRTSLFATWGIYSIAMIFVSQAFAQLELPQSASWAIAAVLGAALVVWTWER